ncbi:MAG TPA: helix-turn-helix transcriptional regulator [Thermoanaerobaculia bacterium]|jgi:transcriptional regulator with XRE-family HTH domain|nr:helix-turn-helix transcriptional regulator [Thermoanaerobaculia bacterium]
MGLKEHVAARIRELRMNHGEGLSQEDLAAELKVATNTVSRWETGTYWPSVEDLDKLARFFHVSVLEFFPTDEQPPQEDHVVQLLRLAKGLRPDDLEELRRYAEYRRARYRLAQAKERAKTRRGKAPA